MPEPRFRLPPDVARFVLLATNREIERAFGIARSPPLFDVPESGLPAGRDPLPGVANLRVVLHAGHPPVPQGSGKLFNGSRYVRVAAERHKAGAGSHKRGTLFSKDTVRPAILLPVWRVCQHEVGAVSRKCSQHVAAVAVVDGDTVAIEVRRHPALLNRTRLPLSSSTRTP